MKTSWIVSFALLCLLAILGATEVKGEIWTTTTDLSKIAKLEYTIDTGNNLIKFKVTANKYTDGKVSKWIGLGISPAQLNNAPAMAHASMTVVHFSEDENKWILTSHTGKDKNTRPIDDETVREKYTLLADECSLNDDSITIAYTRPLVKPEGIKDDEIYYDITSTIKTHVIFAFKDDTDNLSFHGRVLADGNYGSKVLDFYDGHREKPDNAWVDILEYAHGLSMIVAWLILATAGTYIGRYHRKTLKKTSDIIGLLKWYVTHHVILMVGAVTLTFAGFIFILIRQSLIMEPQDIFDVWTKPHTMLGFLIIVSCLFQVVLGGLAGWLFNEKKKSIFAKFHWFFGRMLWISAFINVYLGMQLVSAHTVSWVGYYLWTGAVVGVFAFTKPEVEYEKPFYEMEEETPFMTSTSKESNL